MEKITYVTICSLLISIFGFLSCRDKTNADTTDGIADSIDSKPDTSNVVQKKVLVERIDTLSMIILYPSFDSIDLVCKDMPSQQDENVLLCAEGAYTGEFLETFRHENIAGDHVSVGVRYKGYPCEANTGAFVFYNGQWKFLYKNYSHYLDSADAYNGCGFAQETLIHQGVKRENMHHNFGSYILRALCEREGKLCIIETSSKTKMTEFKSKLIELEVSEALYLDMGVGWNHAWYRINNDSVNVLHLKTHNYCTNWITFFKR